MYGPLTFQEKNDGDYLVVSFRYNKFWPVRYMILFSNKNSLRAGDFVDLTETLKPLGNKWLGSILFEKVKEDA